jgi:hypothetical protein
VIREQKKVRAENAENAEHSSSPLARFEQVPISISSPKRRERGNDDDERSASSAVLRGLCAKLFGRRTRKARGGGIHLVNAYILISSLSEREVG